MSRFTRGFTGRGRQRDDRLPPGQYDTGRSWPALTAEVPRERLFQLALAVRCLAS